MSIASELTRIQGAKSDLKTSIENKGVAVPLNALIDDYAGYVDQIQQGSSGNPFDNVDFQYLCYNGRFKKYADMIKNADKSQIASWSFAQFAYNGTYTSKQAKELFEIVSENVSCGSNNRYYFYQAFQSIKITDNQNDIIFNPISNISKAADFGSFIVGVNEYATVSNIPKITLDFSQFNPSSITISLPYNYANKINIEIIGYPVNVLNGAISYISFNASTGISKFTVRGAAKYNIDIRSLTGLGVSGILDFFNSIDVTTSSKTITIPSTIYNQLTEDQKAIITDKGYVLASA